MSASASTSASPALALAVSPHLDDAVFSCGGTLARLIASGLRVAILTCFTRSVEHPSGFALACQLDKGLGPDVDYMALRRAEEREAASRLGAEPPLFLDFAEAPHRFYHSAAELFGPVDPRDEIAPSLAAGIASVVAALRPALLLAPQAIGGHVDHVVTVEALDTLDLDCPVLWWRDFPYVSREAAPKMPFAARFARLPQRAVAIDRDRKCHACLAYASQLGFQFGGHIGLERAVAASGDAEHLAEDRGRTGAAPRLPALEGILA